MHFEMKHALCVSNATTGLCAIALAIGLHQSEFVTTPYTYGASLSGWLLLGNRPRFADIDPHTLTLDPSCARGAVTAKTKALLAVDIYGNLSDSAGLRQIADECRIWYIADAAQSLGAVRAGLPASALADALVVSFTFGKTVVAGEGGAILTNNSDLYEKLVWFTQHPYRQKRELGLSLTNEFGLNARIHPWGAQCALTRFDYCLSKLNKQQERCFRMIQALNKSGLVEPIQFIEQKMSPSFFRLTAAWKKAPSERALREQLMTKDSEIDLGPAPVKIIYQQPAFIAQFSRTLRKAPECPQAERQGMVRFSILPCRRRVSLCLPQLTALGSSQLRKSTSGLGKRLA